jgi:GTP-binding protein
MNHPGNPLPVVALVGRANAGKSTLFNRLVGERRAIISSTAGTTRDLNFARVSHSDRQFLLMDSGGLEFGKTDPLTGRAVKLVLDAATAADAIIFLLDRKVGFSPADAEAFDVVRRAGRPVITAVNKVDLPSQELDVGDFHALGSERLFFISAAHGRGIEELLDQVVAVLPQNATPEAASPSLKVALVGRPNVGKSSLLNRLAGFERSLVDNSPGTTRDPIDTLVETNGHRVVLVDTAGIRRRVRIEGDIERNSIASALSAIKRSEVVCLVCDASEGITDQDARLARLVEDHGRALVIICNKWDEAARRGRRISAFIRDTERIFPFLGFAAMLFTSALTGDGTNEIIPAAIAAGEAWRAKFQTATLNRILADAIAAMDPPIVNGRRLRLMYVTQVGSAPPRLAFFCNMGREIPAHYERFLQSRFRSALGLVGTPLILEFRRAEGSRRPSVVAAKFGSNEPPPRNGRQRRAPKT